MKVAGFSLIVCACGLGLYPVFNEADSKNTLGHINKIANIAQPSLGYSTMVARPIVETRTLGQEIETELSELLADTPITSTEAHSYEMDVDEESSTSTVMVEPISDSVVIVEPEVPVISQAQSESMEIALSVEKGDTLSSLFQAVGLSGLTAIKIARLDGNKALSRIKVGDVLRFKLDENHQLEQLDLEINAVDSLVISQDGEGGYQSKIISKEIEWRNRAISGEVLSSFGGAAKKAGLSGRQIAELAGIYKWDMDFNLDVRRNDRFTVILEEGYVGNTRIKGKSRILAAEYDGASVGRLTAIRHEYDHGEISYYTPEGRGFQKAFLRAPLNYRRISSGFQPKRYHPILKKWRSHKGTDFAARSGEPVMSTASGKIIHIGRKGAYGKTIVVKHQDGITTLYAHLKGYKSGLKRGARVRQGELIGYVGSTGLSTGPHLHYEFRKNNKQLDPMKVKLPRVTPIKGAELTRFKENASRLVPELAKYRDDDNTGLVARNSN